MFSLGPASVTVSKTKVEEEIMRLIQIGRLKTRALDRFERLSLSEEEIALVYTREKRYLLYLVAGLLEKGQASVSVDGVSQRRIRYRDLVFENGSRSRQYWTEDQILFANLVMLIVD
ncbi:MAG: hypothetical protein JRJ58_17920 [Deltaproteobacteria bacterium]|nr:hypothetical protein [Deltaproteobacteria bacterium]